MESGTGVEERRICMYIYIGEGREDERGCNGALDNITNYPIFTIFY